jgi:class 3 adenylate cyclase
MPSLRAVDRASLPDRAFAYVDARGRRRLPIHDAAHVRNALARFNQVTFEDEQARERARTRLLRAAQKHGIVPVGFITGQVRSLHRTPLPTGNLTLLLCDIEGSTALLRGLEDRYTALLGDVRRILRAAARRQAGHEVDVHGDEFFAVFHHAPDALLAALAMQRGLRDAPWPAGFDVRMRLGIHSGRPSATEHGYVGLAVHAAARIMAAGHGGQILLSESTVRALGDSLPRDLELRELGAQHLRGVGTESLYQAVVADLPSDFPPLRTGAAGSANEGMRT